MKRDDLTGFGLSGNKVRKLEFHFAAAIAAGATTFITCGAVQSNHCRATAVAAAQAGLGCILLLRSSDGQPPTTIEGNHLLQRLVGADVRFITPEQWTERDALLTETAAAVEAGGGTAWTMPAGASDRLGLAAFDVAVDELAPQLAMHGLPAPGRPLTIWHAASSGGTTAGLAYGVHRRGLDARVVGASVGETVEEMHAEVRRVFEDAAIAQPHPQYEVIDDWRGRGYGLTTNDELAIQVQASQLTGLIWDPTYTGKAIYALHQEIVGGRFTEDDDVIFWHTGGGFAAFAHDFTGVL